MIYFFFQAEDGIRDHCVTGVQTCALPICRIFLNDCHVVVNFEKNSAILSDVARSRVLAFSKLLKQSRLPIGSIVIEGFTDASGSDRYNLSLSERRAYSVARILAEQGFEVSKLMAKG